MARHEVRSPTADRVLSDIDRSMEQRPGDRLRRLLGEDVPDDVVRDVARLAVSEIRALRQSNPAAS